MDKKPNDAEADQLRRAKLIKAKVLARAQGLATGPGKVATAGVRNRFSTTASGSTARKSRKGQRPG